MAKTTDTGSIALKDHEATQPAMPHARQLSVLVVLDDAGASAALQALLLAQGHRVVCARSGFMAQESLAEESFQIVIIDRGLEGGDGLRLCAQVRERNERGYVYIILLGPCDSRGDVEGCLQAGADDCSSRNASEAELTARLNTAARIVRLERALREALAHRSQPGPEVATAAQARALLLQRLGRDLERALADDRPLSMLVLDIDSLKNVNDRYGHVAGDELLRQLANRVRFALPHDEDWVARIGGAEFAVVLPDTSIEDAAGVARRLRSTVEATAFHVAGSDVSVTVSVGVGSLSSLSPGDGIDAQALLDQADRYLYRSKLAGRNCVSMPTS